LAESMAAVARDGCPPLGNRVRRTPSGRLAVILLPTSVLDRVMFWRFEGSALLQAGLSPEEARQRQASFYRQVRPTGAVCAVLGAGNVTSIPLMDVLGKLFVEGSVSVLKLHPLMASMQFIVEHALAPLIRPGYVRVVAGDARAGAYLCNHPGVDSIHVTGSEQTYAAIVRGRAVPVATRRPDAAQPPAKLVTAELGNISPVVVAPARYARHELDYQARNLATMVVNNDSYNCNAARLLVTAAGWPQRDAFLVRLRAALQAVPARPAYYPGAREQYAP